MDIEKLRHNAGVLFKVAGVMEGTDATGEWKPCAEGLTLIAGQIQNAVQEIVRLRVDLEKGKALVVAGAERLADRIAYSNALERAATRTIGAIQACAAGVDQYAELTAAGKTLEAAILNVPGIVSARGG